MRSAGSGQGATLDRAAVMAFLYAFLFFLPAAVNDPLATLVEDYQSYGLPLPPTEARVVLLTRSTGTFNGAPQYSQSLVKLGRTEDIAAALEEKPWMAKAPRRVLHTACSQGHLDTARLLLRKRC